MNEYRKTYVVNFDTYAHSQKITALSVTKLLIFSTFNTIQQVGRHTVLATVTKQMPQGIIRCLKTGAPICLALQYIV